MKANQIRSKFLEYFNTKGHQIIKSSSLIPNNDPTLLFTNAGMNQFKNIFLGKEKATYQMAVSSQKCVRAGGKHNDLANVGYTARHHTFFEMLGNFSFGAYFKKEAIMFAWDFLTKVLKIDTKRLYVTVYHTDNDSYDIWHNIINIESDRIIKIGDNPDGSSDNFWQMGDTGPCGPCTEIFYDHGEHILGGLPGSIDADGDRFVEVWNCVFMQFNKQENGVLENLPTPAVDTGMGLERITAVMQGVSNNYDIDIFKYLIAAVRQILLKSNSEVQITDDHPSLRVIADHIRAITFLIADGVKPGNEGRSYVLRRIIRRAISHGYLLNCKKAFLHKLVVDVVFVMQDAYFELINKKEQIIATVLKEEENFLLTIERGMELLMNHINTILNNNLNGKILDGKIAFRLYDTFGFPIDLTEDICKEHDIIIDYDGFNHEMSLQVQNSKNQHKFKLKNQYQLPLDSKIQDSYNTLFCGYDVKELFATVVGIYRITEPEPLKTDDILHPEELSMIILDQTVCYPEGGGQIGDIAIIEKDGSLFEVEDTHKIFTNTIAHIGRLHFGNLKVGDKITIKYDLHNRQNTAKNHSATHLLHKSLQLVLGDSVTQKGSLVSPHIARFDFAYDKPVTIEQLNEIESLVNQAIVQNYPVNIAHMDYNKALESNVMALFENQYSDIVRVVSMADFSSELCGGTHVSATGDIGLFKIISESGVASGVRRIEALTANLALKYVQDKMQILNNVSALLKSGTHDALSNKINALIDEKNQLIKHNNELLNQVVSSYVDKILHNASIICDNIMYVLLKTDNLDNKFILKILDEIKHRVPKIIVIIVNTTIHKELSDVKNLDLFIMLTQSIKDIYDTRKILKYLQGSLDIKGGGNISLSRGTCTITKDCNVDEILNSIFIFLKG